MPTLSSEIDGYWVDLFGEITAEVVPLDYVESVSVTFKNNNNWEIPVSADERDWERIRYNLNEISQDYKSDISDIVFNLDLLQIKIDISSKTTNFLKKHNL